MTGDERRNLILRELQGADAPVSATQFAKECAVTRQIIVADIAILRAAGHAIRSEHRGYVLCKDAAQGLVKKIVCQHTKEQVLDEFYAIVDNGGKVLNVQVEHSIYGLISAELIIASRYDAEEFVGKVSKVGASQLADLTGGVHIHTISVPEEGAFQRIRKRLWELGILVENQ